MELILAVLQIILREFSDCILVLNGLSLSFLSLSFVISDQVLTSPLNVVLAFCLSEVVEFILHLPIGLHHILVVGLVIKVILTSC